MRQRDIDSFVDEASDVERKIRAIMDATPEELEAERQREAEALLAADRRRADMVAWEARRAEKQREEERDRWWRGIQQEEVSLDKYDTDYSRWASIDADKEEREEKENKDFELRNPEFCANFLKDKKERDDRIKQKDKSALGLRLKGNRLFKGGKYDEALSAYRESMGLRPYEVPTVLNMAQVYLKQKDFKSAVEFASRTLACCSGGDVKVKALSRRAAAYEGLGDFDMAKKDLKDALHCKSSTFVQEQLRKLELRIKDVQNEKLVQGCEELPDDILELAALLRLSPEARVACRVTKGVEKLCDRLGESPLVSCALAAAVTGEPASKRIALEYLPKLADLLKADDALTRAAAAEVVAELVDDVGDARVACVVDALQSAIPRFAYDPPGLAGLAHATRAVRDFAHTMSTDMVAILAKVARDVKDDNVLEPATAALAKLACNTRCRDWFAVALDGREGAAETPCGILLRARTECALAAVANACKDCDRARAATLAAGGLVTVFSVLAGEAATATRARAAQLLARLVCDDKQAALALRRSPKALPQLARRLLNSRNDEWAAVERDALVRALAAALDADAVKRLIEQSRDFFPALARVLPEPRKDIDRVTANSVTWPPSAPIPAATACNACKAIIPALSDQNVATDLIADGALERLVCAIANYKELPVRRNCAIVLAKIMALVPASKDRVRELRGLEMITTLGSDLL